MRSAPTSSARWWPGIVRIVSPPLYSSAGIHLLECNLPLAAVGSLWTPFTILATSASYCGRVTRQERLGSFCSAPPPTRMTRRRCAPASARSSRSGWCVQAQSTSSPAAPLDYRAASYELPMILLMGSERSGLPQSLQHLCDAVVQIPMVGRSDSLNLAVATSLMLYEIFRQRQPIALTE